VPCVFALPALAVLQFHISQLASHHSQLLVCIPAYKSGPLTPAARTPLLTPSLAQRTLTAEEWTRQSTSLPCCFFGCLLCFRHSLLLLPLRLFHIAASQPLAVAPFAAVACSPSARQVRLSCTGVELFARDGQVASLHSQLLFVTTSLAPSHFRNSPLATRPSRPSL
jgi:hypothetical protein